MIDDVQYLVKIAGDTAYMSVLGKATYLNCKEAGAFMDYAVEKKCKYLRIDFYACRGMDSTFMGMIAGVTLKLSSKGGAVTLYNLKDRNLELIENLGLDSILNISRDEAFDVKPSVSALSPGVVPKEKIIDAHENLIRAHSTNAEKFEDVIKFLKAEEGMQ